MLNRRGELAKPEHSKVPQP